MKQIIQIIYLYNIRFLAMRQPCDFKITSLIAQKIEMCMLFKLSWIMLYFSYLRILPITTYAQFIATNFSFKTVYPFVCLGYEHLNINGCHFRTVHTFGVMHLMQQMYIIVQRDRILKLKISLQKVAFRIPFCAKNKC